MRDSDRTNPAGPALDTERWRKLHAGARRRLSQWRSFEVDVDDLIAEACLVLAQRGALDACDAQLLDRVVTIARGRAIDSLRRAAARPAISEPEQLDSIGRGQPASRCSGPRLRGLLGRLTPRQRAVLFLRHGLRLEFESIRDVLGGCSTHSIQCLHSRARRALGEMASADGSGATA